MITHKSSCLWTGLVFVATTILASASTRALADGVVIENSSNHPVPATIENNVSTTVTNTVPVNSINEPARSPVKLLYGSSTTSCPVSGLPGLYECSAGPYSVPAGKRLVIQQVSGYVSGSAAPTNLTFYVTNQSRSSFDFQGGTVQYLTPIQVAYYQSSPFLSYFDAGNAVSFAALFTLPSGSSPGVWNLTITGYMIDCTSAPCNPIVTQ